MISFCSTVEFLDDLRDEFVFWFDGRAEWEKSLLEASTTPFPHIIPQDLHVSALSTMEAVGAVPCALAIDRSVVPLMFIRW